MLIFCLFDKGIAQIQFSTQSQFRYLKGSEASGLSTNWMKNDFNDSGWLVGNSPFRYGKGVGGTLLSDMRNNYTTLYLRSTFNALNVEKIKEVKFSVNFDDGFIIWINGKVILSSNAPANPKYNSAASDIHEYDAAFSRKIKSSDISLAEGENTIAIQVLNASISSSDLFFDFKIEANPELPPFDLNGAYVTFSHNAGFYDSPFDLEIKSSDNTLKIAYTIDGSNPSASNTKIISESPLIVRVDPEINTVRGNTPAFIVKASLTKEGFAPSFPETRTFIFPEEVRYQKYPGGGWPEWYVNEQLLDYDMALDVVDDTRYKDQFIASLKEIPTISISTDLGNLFDSGYGIYVNAEKKGEEWERECAIELIYPAGKKGFSVNAGLRIRGGNSAKNGDNPKHAFRIFFKEEYGLKKLKYPLFGEKGAPDFDCFDLRCEQNYSWNMDGDPHNVMVKDIYCRDMQGLMGQPNSKGNKYHLYINGMYWGMFETDERPEASYAESYFGGDKEDYDVVKVNTQGWPYKNEATDGTMDSWNALWNICQKGFETNKKYFSLEGKDEYGNRIDTARVWVDIDNMIDYMLLVFYTGNFDAPVSAWSSNDMPNNFFAIFDRKNKSKGYKFIAHDSEHCMFVDKMNVDEGINENRVNIGSTGKMKITDVLDFNPQWLHYKLCSNSEYRLRFADRAAKYLSNGGLFTPEKVKYYFNKRVAEIDTAIIAESARWGDAKSWWDGGSLNRNDDWLPEIENINNNYIPFRTDIVIQQLKDEKLYSDNPAPEISVLSNIIIEDIYKFNQSCLVSISNNKSGTIFYTLDGNDPRSLGGAIYKNAFQSGSKIDINISSTTVVSARVKNGEDWGSIEKIIFIRAEEDYSHLKVTELNYHPSDYINYQDTVGDKSLEFIEFKNTGNTSIDLSGLKLDSAITYIFPENTILNPGEYYVVASKPNSYYLRYKSYPDGNYEGQFSNSGEYVLLTDRLGNEILSFTYYDIEPWPLEADGDGYSLTSVEDDPTGDPNDPNYWKLSLNTGGSPGLSDENSVSSEEISKQISDSDNIFVYPNPTNEYLFFDFKDSSVKDFANIFIVDINGRIVLRDSFNQSHKINLNELNISNGIYVLRIQFPEKIVSQKFIYTAGN